MPKPPRATTPASDLPVRESFIAQVPARRHVVRGCVGTHLGTFQKLETQSQA